MGKWLVAEEVAPVRQAELFLLLKCMSDGWGAVLCLTQSVDGNWVIWGGGETAENGITQASQVRLICKDACFLFEAILQNVPQGTLDGITDSVFMWANL